MASRRQAALLRRRAVLRWRHALLRVRRRTSCFASTTYDVRRRALCFASTTRSAFPSRSACFAQRALLRCTQSTQPSVSQIACVVCPCLPFLSLSLPWRRRSLLFLAFPFSQEEHRTGTPATACVLDVPSTCFCWRCKPSNRKFLCASRRFVLPAL